MGIRDFIKKGVSNHQLALDFLSYKIANERKKSDIKSWSKYDDAVDSIANCKGNIMMKVLGDTLMDEDSLTEKVKKDLENMVLKNHGWYGIKMRVVDGEYTIIYE